MGAAVECGNYLHDLGVTPMADCFDCTESSGESVWGVQCLRIECVDIERVLGRVTIWWHGAGAKSRMTAILKRGFDDKGANAAQNGNELLQHCDKDITSAA